MSGFKDVTGNNDVTDNPSEHKSKGPETSEVNKTLNENSKEYNPKNFEYPKKESDVVSGNDSKKVDNPKNQPQDTEASGDNLKKNIDDSEQQSENKKQKIDVSDNYKYRTYERDGRRYKEASGQLGIPGEVVDHRDATEQRKISKGTGDDAGHLIGNQFGASGGPENLSPQNWRENRSGGTYKQLENEWAKKLKDGTEIDVKVADITRKGEDRPFMRKVEWTETAKDGTKTDKELYFANTYTPESRDKRGIEDRTKSTKDGKNNENVIYMDAWKEQHKKQY